MNRFKKSESFANAPSKKVNFFGLFEIQNFIIVIYGHPWERSFTMPFIKLNMVSHYVIYTCTTANNC